MDIRSYFKGSLSTSASNVGTPRQFKRGGLGSIMAWLLFVSMSQAWLPPRLLQAASPGGSILLTAVDNYYLFTVSNYELLSPFITIQNIDYLGIYNTFTPFVYSETIANEFDIYFDASIKGVRVKFGPECLFPIFGLSINKGRQVGVAKDRVAFKVSVDMLGIPGFNQTPRSSSSRKFDNIESLNAVDQADVFEQYIDLQNVSSAAQLNGLVYCPYYKNPDSLKMSFQLLAEYRAKKTTILLEEKVLLDTQEGAVVENTYTVLSGEELDLSVENLSQGVKFVFDAPNLSNDSIIFKYTENSNDHAVSYTAAGVVVPPTAKLTIAIINPSKEVLSLRMRTSPSSDYVTASDEKGPIAGIVIGTVVGVVALILVILAIVFRKRLKACLCHRFIKSDKNISDLRTDRNTVWQSLGPDISVLRTPRANVDQSYLPLTNIVVNDEKGDPVLAALKRKEGADFANDPQLPSFLGELPNDRDEKASTQSQPGRMLGAHGTPHVNNESHDPVYIAYPVLEEEEENVKSVYEAKTIEKKGDLKLESQTGDNLNARPRPQQTRDDMHIPIYHVTVKENDAKLGSRKIIKMIDRQSKRDLNPQEA